MTLPHIGILGSFNDADVQSLKANIEDRGGAATIIDLALLSQSNVGSVDLDELVYDGTRLLDFDAFYIRGLAPIWSVPVPAISEKEWRDYYMKFNDFMDNLRALHSFKLSLARILCEKKTVINPYQAWDLHHLKVHQYVLLKENNFKVPAFLSGNNYFDLKAFLEEYPAVEKPVVTGPVRRIGVKELDSERARLRDRPVIYQEFIEGTSIRAFVLGDQVIVACVLPTKEWGVDASERIEYMQRITLPSEIEAEVARSANTLGMVFCGVDLQYRQETGEYYFLECNVAPYFRPYDAQVGADIGGKLAEYLLQRAKQGC